MRQAVAEAEFPSWNPKRPSLSPEGAADPVLGRGAGYDLGCALPLLGGDVCPAAAPPRSATKAGFRSAKGFLRLLVNLNRGRGESETHGFCLEIYPKYSFASSQVGTEGQNWRLLIAFFFHSETPPGVPCLRVTSCLSFPEHLCPGLMPAPFRLAPGEGGGGEGTLCLLAEPREGWM